MSATDLGTGTCYLQLVTLCGDVVEPGWKKSSSVVVWPFLLTISSHVDCFINAITEFWFLQMNKSLLCKHCSFFTVHLLVGLYVVLFPDFGEE